MPASGGNGETVVSNFDWAQDGLLNQRETDGCFTEDEFMEFEIASGVLLPWRTNVVRIAIARVACESCG
jgi:hypothetical protein